MFVFLGFFLVIVMVIILDLIVEVKKMVLYLGGKRKFRNYKVLIVYFFEILELERV